MNNKQLIKKAFEIAKQAKKSDEKVSIKDYAFGFIDGYRYRRESELYELTEHEQSQIFEFDGSCYKEDMTPFTQEERDEVMDSFIEWVVSKGMFFGGGLG